MKSETTMSVRDASRGTLPGGTLDKSNLGYNRRAHNRRDRGVYKRSFKAVVNGSVPLSA